MKVAYFLFAILISAAITFTTAVPTYSDVKSSIDQINTVIQQFTSTTPTSSPFSAANLNKLESNIKSVETAFKDSTTIILSYRDGRAPTVTSEQVSSIIKIMSGTIKPFKTTCEAIIHIQANIAALKANDVVATDLQSMATEISNWVTAFTNIIDRKDIKRFEVATVELENDSVAACKAYGGSCY